jgi:hypothetical protein
VWLASLSTSDSYRPYFSSRTCTQKCTES